MTQIGPINRGPAPAPGTACVVDSAFAALLVADRLAGPDPAVPTTPQIARPATLAVAAPGTGNAAPVAATNAPGDPAGDGAVTADTRHAVADSGKTLPVEPRALAGDDASADSPRTAGSGAPRERPLPQTAARSTFEQTAGRRGPEQHAVAMPQAEHAAPLEPRSLPLSETRASPPDGAAARPVSPKGATAVIAPPDDARLQGGAGGHHDASTPQSRTAALVDTPVTASAPTRRLAATTTDAALARPNPARHDRAGVLLGDSAPRLSVGSAASSEPPAHAIDRADLNEATPEPQPVLVAPPQPSPTWPLGELATTKPHRAVPAPSGATPITIPMVEGHRPAGQLVHPSEATTTAGAGLATPQDHTASFEPAPSRGAAVAADRAAGLTVQVAPVPETRSAVVVAAAPHVEALSRITPDTAPSVSRADLAAQPVTLAASPVKFTPRAGRLYQGQPADSARPPAAAALDPASLIDDIRALAAPSDAPTGTDRLFRTRPNTAFPAAMPPAGAEAGGLLPELHLAEPPIQVIQPTATDRQQTLTAMIDRIETLIADGPDSTRETRVKLTPDALGEVSLRLIETDRGIEVAIDAAAPEARAMLAEAAPRLAEMAEARGLRLSPQMAGGDAGDARHRAPQQQPQPGNAQPNHRAASDRDTRTDDERIA